MSDDIVGLIAGFMGWWCCHRHISRLADTQSRAGNIRALVLKCLDLALSLAYPTPAYLWSC